MLRGKTENWLPINHGCFCTTKKNSFKKCLQLFHGWWRFVADSRLQWPWKLLVDVIERLRLGKEVLTVENSDQSLYGLILRNLRRENSLGCQHNAHNNKKACLLVTVVLHGRTRHTKSIGSLNMVTSFRRLRFPILDATTRTYVRKETKIFRNL